jgi:hypothetical protein
MSGGPVTKIVDRCRHAVTTAGNDGGLPGLAQAPIPGRPTWLTTEQRLEDTVVREADGQLMLIAQPAYSPELNPEERIWKWMRRIVTHNHWFESLTAQIERIRDFFRYLAGCKDQIRRLCGLKTHESIVALL